MLTLRTLLALPVALSTILVTFALAAPQGCITNDPTDKHACNALAAQLTGGEGCESDKLKDIRDGFYDMNDLFQAALNPNFDTGEPEREFFGTRDRIGNYTSLIEANIRQASWYSNLLGNATRNPDIHVRCDDPNDVCDFGPSGEGHVAYNIGNEPHINFCKEYFKLHSLEHEVENTADDDGDKDELMKYYNRGTAWAREVMHISGVANGIVEAFDGRILNDSTWGTSMFTRPINISVLAGVQNYMDSKDPFVDGKPTLKYAYGATRAKILAILSTQMPYDTANNGESYALFAQARYVMAKKNFYPSQPQIKYTSELGLLMDNSQQDDDNGHKYAFWGDVDVVPLKNEESVKAEPIASSASSRMDLRLLSAVSPASSFWLLLLPSMTWLLA